MQDFCHLFVLGRPESQPFYRAPLEFVSRLYWPGRTTGMVGVWCDFAVGRARKSTPAATVLLASRRTGHPRRFGRESLEAANGGNDTRDQAIVVGSNPAA